MDLRMQGLDAAIEDFGKPGDLGHLRDGSTVLRESPEGSTRRKDLDPALRERSRKVASPLLSDTEMRARSMRRRSWGMASSIVSPPNICEGGTKCPFSLELREAIAFDRGASARLLSGGG